MRRAFGLVALIAVAACRDQAAPTSLGISTAVSSGGVTVTATEPDTATQDTTLDVVVKGSGFDRGSSAQWAIGGVPSTKIRTNSTRFVTSKQLVANITIALDAEAVTYDVLVTTAGGKKGIGTELFTVRPKGPPPDGPQAIFEYTADDGALKIRSDHRAEYLSADGLRFIYEAGVCGVTGQFYVTGSGDATMSPAGATIPGNKRNACGALRSITVIFDQPADGGPLTRDPIATGNFFNNMKGLWFAPIGVEIEGQAGFNVSRCNIVRFKPEPDINPNYYPGSDKVLVLRIDERTWRVRTKPFPNNKAWCDTEQRFYHLPFDLIVRVK